jgi:hypothetical protein
VPDTSQTALAALRADMSAFYQREMQCSDRCKAYIVERSPGVFLLSVQVKDLPMVRLEFEGDELTRHVGNPNIHSVVEYSAITGVSRSLAKGGAKYHQALLKAFAEHLLQVKSITLLSPDTQLKLDCTAMASSEQRCVTDLLAEKLPVPLTDRWLITAAQINLHYPPVAGEVRLKVVTVEVTRKGRLNLHKFDATLQAQLKRYLVSLGIFDRAARFRSRQMIAARSCWMSTGCDRDCEWPSTSKAPTVSLRSPTVSGAWGMRDGSRCCSLEVWRAYGQNRRSSIASGSQAQASASSHHSRPQHGARRFRPASNG